MAETWTLIHGYQHVSGVPSCPCGDPGNYLMLEESNEDPLIFRYTCWCGRTLKGKYDNAEERLKIHSQLKKE